MIKMNSSQIYNTKPLLSVIVPVYNVEKYLEKCLDSICGQSYENIEIICIDDGSTDKSAVLLDDYAKMDSRIMVIHQNNHGPMIARKEGISLAHGEYTTFFDSDDWLELNTYEEMIGYANEYETDIVSSGFIREYGNKSIDGYEGISKGLYKGDDYRQHYLYKFIGVDHFFEFNVPGSLCNKIFRTGLLKEFFRRAPEKISIGSDAVVTYPLLLNADSVFVTGKNYLHYRIREGSITSKKCAGEIDNVRRLFDYMERECKKKNAELPLIEKQIKLWEFYILISKWPELVVQIQNGHIFPFGDVKFEESLLLYGMGRFGKFLFDYLRKIGVNIIGFVDARRVDNSISIETLKKEAFDRILITVLRASEVEEIRKHLLEYGVMESQISSIRCDELLERDIYNIIDRYNIREKNPSI